MAKFLILNLICKRLQRFTQLKHTKSLSLLHPQKKLFVLRCKKAEEYQCLWKLRAMVVKSTYIFVINKYKVPHICVNHYLNRGHHQLDSNLVVAHIKAIIKAQFTLTMTAIQVSVIEK